MKNQKQTIRKIVSVLNNADEDGGFWLPNIQRPFVWSEDQICKLFDSIMREYPISTLLIWKTTSTIRHRKFIDNWNSSLRLSDFYVPEDSKKKCLVLDGQQRLQSLYIGLCGSFEGKELCFDVLSGDLSAPDEIKYKFKFCYAAEIMFPWVKFKDLIFTTKKKREMLDNLKTSAGRPLSEKEQNKLDDHLDIIDRTFKMDEAVTYQELDSIDNPALYKEDDVVEVFIRANSGGTKLGKSDLLFSLLSSSWEEADKKMEVLLDSLNTHGFEFDRDFVLKTCLVLIGQGAKYEVEKFRKEGVRESIEAKWNEIAGAIQAVLDFVREKTFIQCDKALPSYNVLVPLVYLRYQYEDSWKKAKDVDTYLLRCLLGGAFSGVPDNIIDALVKKLTETKTFDVNEIFSVIRTQNRSLEVPEERFWQMGYGSSTIHLLFNVWYRSFNYTPAYLNNMPQIDHVFPQSILKDIKVLNPETNRMIMKYDASRRNQLANCMLLSREENGAGGKSDMPPEEWFPKRIAEEGPDYLKKHLIPPDEALWKIDRFEDFIVARRKLIQERFKSLIVPAVKAKI
ncbi:DUF262 domain-containing protein [Dehalococcoides mccartyi]|uniref:DUF262 domain-containing protein n=1 Tax=Dehalococcoides mccartyi TaxID=61435 RepID=UPI001A0BEAB0|nr:DUF262 domain-containing protein [Dehalococcoides mccartyi]MBF4483171.1 DUF262 domain-containing protein [Dehalococcoides mccartyi]MBJ7531702.1 DUF262 domain-containing protein [Dehalococcoides mccartyi]